MTTYHHTPHKVIAESTSGKSTAARLLHSIPYEMRLPPPASIASALPGATTADASAKSIFGEYAACSLRTHCDTGTLVSASDSLGAIFGSISAQPTMYTR